MINPPVTGPGNYDFILRQATQTLEGMGFRRNLSRAALEHTTTGDFPHEMINIQDAIDAIHTWQANGSRITLYLNVRDRRINGQGGATLKVVTPDTTIEEIIAWEHNRWPLNDDDTMRIRRNNQVLLNGDTIASAHMLDLLDTRPISWQQNIAGNPPNIPAVSIGAVEAFNLPPPALAPTPIGGKRKSRKGKKGRKSRKSKKSRKSRK